MISHCSFLSVTRYVISGPHDEIKIHTPLKESSYALLIYGIRRIPFGL